LPQMLYIFVCHCEHLKGAWQSPSQQPHQDCFVAYGFSQRQVGRRDCGAYFEA
jgi:hypothetical protein